MAYVHEVNQSSNDSHQVSPGWMLTFIRWANRSPHEIKGIDPQKTLEPLVVISDCISVSVSSSKASHTPHMAAVLVSTDINYLAAVAPGDFVFVNMVDFDTQINQDLYVRANSANPKPINGINDGFKGLFKVQSVRRNVQVDQDGSRQVIFTIDGYAFTEFNNSIYFTPSLVDKSEFKDLLFVSNINERWTQIYKQGRINLVQELVQFFIDSFLGQGVSPKSSKVKINNKTIQKNFNTHFFVPRSVGALLGQPDANAAKDLYVMMYGIQKYDNSAESPDVGFLPSGLAGAAPSENRNYNAGPPCQGKSLPRAEYWNQTPVWSIIQQYLNSPINECYNAFKIAPTGDVMPTFTMRQIPFSSESYHGLSTKFLNLPRWKISTKMILSADVGRDEAARLNFVQVFGVLSDGNNQSSAISFQNAQGNYDYDPKDIPRSGLRPYVITSNFDYANSGSVNISQATGWAKLMGDALIGGHLKLNGTVTCFGIQEPISPGDNLELEGVVYHIESVSHQSKIDGNGSKSFLTVLELSHGVAESSTAQAYYYPQMDLNQAEDERERQYAIDGGLYDGYSDTQFLPSRPDGVKKPKNSNTLNDSKEKINDIVSGKGKGKNK